MRQLIRVRNSDLLTRFFNGASVVEVANLYGTTSTRIFNIIRSEMAFLAIWKSEVKESDCYLTSGIKANKDLFGKMWFEFIDERDGDVNIENLVLSLLLKKVLVENNVFKFSSLISLSSLEVIDICKDSSLLIGEIERLLSSFDIDRCSDIYVNKPKSYFTKENNGPELNQSKTEAQFSELSQSEEADLKCKELHASILKKQKKPVRKSRLNLYKRDKFNAEDKSKKTKVIKIVKEALLSEIPSDSIYSAYSINDASILNHSLSFALDLYIADKYKAILINLCIEHGQTFTFNKLFNLSHNRLKNTAYIGVGKLIKIEELRVGIENKSPEVIRKNSLLGCSFKTWLNHSIKDALDSYIPKRFKSALRFLLKRSDSNITMRELCLLHDEFLINEIDFNPKKMKEINLFKEWILILFKENTFPLRGAGHNLILSSNDLLLDDIYINAVNLTKIERMVLFKLSAETRIRMDKFSLYDLFNYKRICSGKRIVENWPECLILIDKIMSELKKYFGENLEISSGLIKGSNLLTLHKQEVFTENELDEFLSIKLSAYINSSYDRNSKIFTDKFGIKTNAINQSDALNLSNESVSRQRASQIRNSEVEIFIHSMGCDLDVVRNALNKSLKNGLDLPIFIELFETKSGFYSFIGKILNISPGEISKELDASCSPTFINEWFINHPAPLTIDDCATLIACNTKHTKIEANVVIKNMQLKSHIVIRNENVVPLKLKPYQAICQLALNYPEGVHFKDLLKELSLRNEYFGVTQNMNFDILPQTAKNKGLFLCGIGTYKHINFFELSKDDINSVLNKVKDKLSTKVKGKWYSLEDDVYNKGMKRVGYYNLRHVVNKFGFDVGLEFKGNSCVDSIRFI